MRTLCSIVPTSNHPNVVPILDSYLVQTAKTYEVWVVLQFLQYGALTEALTQVSCAFAVCGRCGC